MFRNLGYAETALDGLGLAAALPRAAAIETDDPFTLAEALAPAMALRTGWTPASFLPLGAPREVLRQALRALRPAAAPEVVPMPEAAPFGAALVAAEGCSLCLACTMVCPTGAFSANPERPQLRFLEEACVQCGLCAATCPERVISLAPRLNFAEAAAQPQMVKEEEPFHCTRCAKAFGTASSITRVKSRLAASGHWMFADPSRLALLELCEDCRAAEATLGGVDPYAGPSRPVVRTTEDWLRKAEEG
jgi:ferredoxin